MRMEGTVHNEHIGEIAAARPLKLSCIIGSSSPADSSVNAATALSHHHIDGNFESAVQLDKFVK